MTTIKKNDLDVAETFTEKYGSLIWEKEIMVSVDQANPNMAPAKSDYTLGYAEGFRPLSKRKGTYLRVACGFNEEKNENKHLLYSPYHLLKTPNTKSVITTMIISIPMVKVDSIPAIYPIVTSRGLRNPSKERDDYEGKAMWYICEAIRLHHEELQKEKQKRQIMLEGFRKLVTPLNEQFLMSPDMSSTIATYKDNKDDAVQASDLRFSGLLLKKGPNYKMEGIVDGSSGKLYEGGFNPSPTCVRKYILKGVPIIRYEGLRCRPGTKVFREDST
ncbi:hypothetical protein BDK51DRAFT_27873 [Blyttiomyces helicus]|uniref:Uncharacterized protein n=1 Tax=Blyttiomyces helicus TaxID=388810 RepID=A0A4P9W9F4_9FUNG|nr:hypothetical protein BDK51DRAFT_27873 [Blyttiomyces helicus]|eukprot:RKO88145.1 hypothetical protein BDK51DRAFT_27873 [Blyttiomyces helicus]